uniref:G protein-coupled receptor n=1 Tax=Globodera pallida TaxID=36090 RepID=A0A183BXI6_GLOPA
MFNISLIYVTCCSKSLHGICNVLIALESLFGTTMDATFYVSFLVVISGLRFIRYQYCFPIIIVPGVVMGNCAQLAMVLTGLDRLIAVLFPLCMMSCSTTEKTTGNLAALMNANGYTLSAILMTFYGLLCFLVFKLSATAKNFDNESKKLVKAMVFIIAFNLFGVFIKCFVQFLFQFVVVDVFFKNYYGIAFSFVTIAVYSANAPVLYVISSEYRARFNKHFKWLPRIFIRKQIGQKQTRHVGISTIVLKPYNYSVRLRNAGGPNFAPSGAATATIF